MSRPLVLLLALFCILALPAFSQSKPVITVLDFKTDGVSDKEMRSIIELLSSALFNTGKFQVIDVTQRETLLKEVEFSSSECSDESCQLKIGQMLAAEMIVVGNIGKVGSRYLVSAKMLETETARTHSASDGIFMSLDAVVDALPDLAKKLAGISTQSAPAAATKTESTQEKPETAAKPAATIQPAKPASLKTIGGIAGVATGVLAGGAGGWLLYNAVTAGKATVDAAEAAYQATTEANATSTWNALLAAASGMKTRIYLGIGCAGAGIALGGLGTVLFLLPSKQPTTAAKVSMTLVPSRGAALLSFSIRY
jgi:hypothetical protein